MGEDEDLRARIAAQIAARRREQHADALTPPGEPVGTPSGGIAPGPSTAPDRPSPARSGDQPDAAGEHRVEPVVAVPAPAVTSRPRPAPRTRWHHRARPHQAGATGHGAAGPTEGTRPASSEPGGESAARPTTAPPRSPTAPGAPTSEHGRPQAAPGASDAAVPPEVVQAAVAAYRAEVAQLREQVIQLSAEIEGLTAASSGSRTEPPNTEPPNTEPPNTDSPAAERRPRPGPARAPVLPAETGSPAPAPAADRTVRAAAPGPPSAPVRPQRANRLLSAPRRGLQWLLAPAPEPVPPMPDSAAPTAGTASAAPIAPPADPAAPVESDARPVADTSKAAPGGSDRRPTPAADRAGAGPAKPPRGSSLVTGTAFRSPGSTEETSPTPPKRSPLRRTLRTGVRTLVLLAVLVAAAVGMRSFVVAPYYIPSASMEPTLHGCTGCTNDHVLVDKLSYRLHDLNRGDVIVFDRPASWKVEDKVLVKRVVGVPGDVVTTVHGIVFVDGLQLDEPYLNRTCGGGTTNLTKTTIPAGQVFVMGDNRCNSADSRMFGTVPRTDVIGRAFVIIWPFGRIHWL